VVDGAEAERANRLVHRKYGWRKKSTELRYKRNPDERVTIAVLRRMDNPRHKSIFPDAPFLLLVPPG